MKYLLLALVLFASISCKKICDKTHVTIYDNSTMWYRGDVAYKFYMVEDGCGNISSFVDNAFKYKVGDTLTLKP